jgi:hypothetical protein
MATTVTKMSATKTRRIQPRRHEGPFSTEDRELRELRALRGFGRLRALRGFLAFVASAVFVSFVVSAGAAGPSEVADAAARGDTAAVRALLAK